jgi:uncharacterized protein (DUF885 family)
MAGIATQTTMFSGTDCCYATASDLLTAYRSALAQIEPLLPKLSRKVAVLPMRVEPVRHEGPSAMYDRRNGTIAVEVGHLKLRPKFEVMPVMLHEGLPGRHFQLGRERESEGRYGVPAEALTRLRLNSAYSEGWALYAESLGGELGLYDDPRARFGRLSMDLLRAVRLVIDSGIHLRGWSTEQAKEYFVKQTGKPAESAVSEVMRASMPATMAAYKLGEMRIRALRERVASKLGEKFDIREFHEAVLEWGPMPLDILDAKFDECLKQPECQLILSGPGK